MSVQTNTIERETLQFILSLNKSKRLMDQNAFRASLDKPLLLDNPTKVTLFEMNRRRVQRERSRILQQRAKRSVRRLVLTAPSPTLQEKLYQTWKLHYEGRKYTALDLSKQIDLHGAMITVKSCLLRKMKIGITKGMVIKETPLVVHLSIGKRIITIPKRGTIFECEGIEFQRFTNQV
jgi:RNase P/RNase MRP subunit p29